MKRFFSDRRAELEEAALTLPLLVLLSVAIINVTMLIVSAAAANNAANIGARTGAVAQSDPAAAASVAAEAAAAVLTWGTHTVSVSYSGGGPGTTLTVTVEYTVPNMFRPLTALFGVAGPENFQVQQVAAFRKEGW